MKPVDFKESTKTLQRPRNMNEEECGSLSVFCDGFQCVSKWNMSWKERFHCFFRGFVWLRVLSGKTQPPVLIQAEKTIFN